MPESKPTSDRARRQRWRQLPWLLIATIAVMEIAGHAVVRSRVPAQRDWEAAATFVDEHFEERDTVAAGPDWADPLLRLHLGERIDFARAGASDLAPFERLWELSIRGRPSRWRPQGPEAWVQSFGRVTVRRWDLGASPVLFDLTANVSQAIVHQGARTCAWQQRAPSGGGLGRGPLKPRGHHHCGPEPWLFVGETVNEDLDLLPRHCIWQHPVAGQPVTTTYTDIPLGDRLVLYAGLYSEHERMHEHPPVRVRVSVDGEPVGAMTHIDGDGWKRIEARMPDRDRGEVSIAVEADEPHLRTLCWAATTRAGERQ